MTLKPSKHFGIPLTQALKFLKFLRSKQVFSQGYPKRFKIVLKNKAYLVKKTTFLYYSKFLINGIKAQQTFWNYFTACLEISKIFKKQASLLLGIS